MSYEISDALTSKYMLSPNCVRKGISVIVASISRSFLDKCTYSLVLFVLCSVHFFFLPVIILLYLNLASFYMAISIFNLINSQLTNFTFNKS